MPDSLPSNTKFLIIVVFLFSAGIFVLTHLLVICVSKCNIKRLRASRLLLLNELCQLLIIALFNFLFLLYLLFRLMSVVGLFESFDDLVIFGCAF